MRALFVALLYISVPRVGAAAIQQIDITGTVDFVGCPSPISCPSFPLMWGVTGGEPMTARLIYDEDSPLAFLDDAAPEYVSARYDHSLPLSPPLAVEVQFGPYSLTAGPSGAPAARYALHLFDDLESVCCPDLSESIAVELVVVPFSFLVSAPPGFHDLDLRSVRLDFLNYSGIDDLLSGPALPPGFPALPWEEIRLTVDVYDPIHARDGRAFLRVATLQSGPLPALPTLSLSFVAALVAGLGALGCALATRDS